MEVNKKSLIDSFSGLFGIQLLLIFVLGGLIVVLYVNQLNLAKSRDSHFNSYLLADELRQSSDDLTRMARAYVATGNPEFEREYWTILDIRNGILPRPTAYNRIYWDFVAATGQKPRPDGEKVPLRVLMVKEGFTLEELTKLELAQKNSDGLVKAETVAMNAMKGLFEDENGKFTIQREPDVKLANTLMNDENYYKTKAEIMRPIDEFYRMFQQRTEQAVARYLRISNILFWCVILLGIFIIISFGISFEVIRRQIAGRELVEDKLYDLQKDLEKKVEQRTSELKNVLAESERINNLMVGRELKMLELKQELRNLKEKDENKN